MISNIHTIILPGLTFLKLLASGRHIVKSKPAMCIRIELVEIGTRYDPDPTVEP